MFMNGPELTPDGSFLLGEAAETLGYFRVRNEFGWGATGGSAGMALACMVNGPRQWTQKSIQSDLILPAMTLARLRACASIGQTL